jgi:hypothetical protein
MNGKIDLTGNSHIYVPPVSDDDEHSDSAEDEQSTFETPDIFNP